MILRVVRPSTVEISIVKRTGMRIATGATGVCNLRLREWWNGRHARLRIWSRKGWRFKSSLAHQLVLHQFEEVCVCG